jgi:hypothetical protein
MEQKQNNIKKKKIDFDNFISKLNEDERIELFNKLILRMNSIERQMAWPKHICRECLGEMTPRSFGKDIFTCWGCFESNPT